MRRVHLSHISRDSSAKTAEGCPLATHRAIPEYDQARHLDTARHTNPTSSSRAANTTHGAHTYKHTHRAIATDQRKAHPSNDLPDGGRHSTLHLADVLARAATISIPFSVLDPNTAAINHLLLAPQLCICTHASAPGWPTPRTTWAISLSTSADRRPRRPIRRLQRPQRARSAQRTPWPLCGVADTGGGGGVCALAHSP